MRVLELFCGAGGLSEGFRRAGIAVEFALDADREACESYRANLGSRPLQLCIADLLRLVRGGWRPGPALDLVVADPPYAPRALEEGMHSAPQLEADEAAVEVGAIRECFEQLAELIVQLQPRAYLLANLPSRAGEPHPVMREVLERLHRAGYCVVDGAELDAADFGVPQRRRRRWAFGHRRGACVRWPLATHADASELRDALPTVETRQPWRTCREALSHLALEQLGRPRRMRRARACAAAPTSTLDRPAHCIGPGNGSSVLCVEEAREPWLRERAVVSMDSSEQWWARTVDRSGPVQVVLSETAGMLLQGLPECWSIVGRTRRARWRQIGELVPPALAQAIAGALIAQRNS
jgi:site-specific DNA-cytosine methylase